MTVFDFVSYDVPPPSSGEVTVEGALETLRDFPFADLVFAKPDTHRALRTGQPEVIFGEGKTSAPAGLQHCSAWIALRQSG